MGPGNGSFAGGRSGGHLLEREREADRVDQALRRAAAGSGEVLVVEGPAGIGKTTLLELASAGARRRGMGVLSATAAETERDFSFGVVRELLERTVREADVARREVLLAGAAGAARPLLAAKPSGVAGARPVPFDALAHGLLWVVAGLAEEQPLLVSVDDAHWADEPSIRFLTYLGRRVTDLPVLLLVAARPHEPDGEREQLRVLAEVTGATRLVPAPLSVPALARLTEVVLGRVPEAAFALACAQATSGNPRLLTELLRELARSGVSPSGVEARAVAEARPESVERMALARIGSLPPDAVAVARAVAVLERARFEAVAALAGVARQAAERAVDALVAADVLVTDPAVAFVHPILRAALYRDIPPRERARRHLEAARVLERLGEEPERVAAHLCATDLALEPEDVAALHRAAREALGRGAPEIAARCLRRATEGDAQGPGAALLVTLGTAEVLAGEPSAAATLERAVRQAEAPREAAEAGRLLSAAYAQSGRNEDALAALDHALARLDGADRELALVLEAHHGTLAMLSRGQSAAARLERFTGLPGETPGERLVLAALALRQGLAGGGLDAVAQLARRALAGGRLLEEQSDLFGPGHAVVQVLLLSEAFEEADALIALERRIARVRGSAAGAVAAAVNAALSAVLQGDLRTAESETETALEVARAVGGALFGAALSYAVHVRAERGALDAADAALRDAGLEGEVPGAPVTAARVLAVRGRLRLEQRRTEEGVRDLLELRRRDAESGHVYLNPVLDWRPAAVRGLLALGRPDEAAAIAEERGALAEQRGSRRERGVTLRLTGLARDDLEALRGSVAVLEDARAPLELAVALADLGGALRRRRSPADARPPLRRAIDLADRCGALRLAGHAEEELAATGVRRRRSRLEADLLTPSERRIAAMAAEGLTNKEIAQALFVTLKTVESHLGSAYRKLGIASRRELAAALAAASAAPAAAL